MGGTRKAGRYGNIGATWPTGERLAGQSDVVFLEAQQARSHHVSLAGGKLNRHLAADNLRSARLLHDIDIVPAKLPRNL